MDRRLGIDKACRSPEGAPTMRQDVAYALILLMVLGAGLAIWRARARRRRRPRHIRIDLTGDQGE
jgi:hypothetical protein